MNRHHRCNERFGFTLVELMVVIFIIIVLAGLLVGVLFPALRERAKVNETERRLGNLIAGVQLYQAGDNRFIDVAIPDVTGRDIRLVSLRRSLEALIDHRPTLLTDTTDTYFPPRIRSRAWVKSKGRGGEMGQIGSNWRMPGQGLDHEIAFLDRQLPKPWNPNTREPWKGTWTYYYPQDVYASTAQKSGGGGPTPIYRSQYAQGPSLGWNYDPDRNVKFLPRSWKDSPIGESLSSTLEVYPTDAWYTDDFYSNWPNVTQEISGGGSIYLQKSWKAQDGEFWVTDATDRAVDSYWKRTSTDAQLSTPIWGAPWGQRVFSRNYQDGYLVPYVEPHNLREMNPLITPRLLEYAGIMESIENWRTDRNPNAQWNDAWGNPLFMAAAVYHAPRYDFDDVNELVPWGPESGGGGGAPPATERVVVSSELHGGRDFLYRKAQNDYGYARAMYLTAGAVGPAADFDLPNSWEEADEQELIQNAWTQILEVTGADMWDETSFNSQPWNGVLSGTRGASTSYIIQPSVIR